MTYLSYVYSCNHLPFGFVAHIRPIVCKSLVLLPCTPMLSRSECLYSLYTLFPPNTTMPQYCQTLLTAGSAETLRYHTDAFVLRHILRILRYTPSRPRILHPCFRTTSILPSKRFLMTIFAVRSSLLTFATRLVQTLPTIPTFNSTGPLDNVCISHLVFLPSKRYILLPRYCELREFSLCPCNSHVWSNNYRPIESLQTHLLVIYFGLHASMTLRLR